MLEPMNPAEIAAMVAALRKRAADDRKIQANNEVIAAALMGQRILFDQGFRSDSNTFAVRLGLDYGNCAKNDAKLAADWDSAADMLEALQSQLAAKPQAAPVRVQVKPLEWLQCQLALPRGVLEAKSCFGSYVAWPNGNWRLYGAYGYEQEGDINSAKAAAQADYERRILSALAGQP